MIRATRALALAMTLATLVVAPASAHKPSDSYLTLSIAEGGVEGRWDIALRDLEHAIGLDADGDGVLTWGEVQARHRDIAAYALSRLRIAAEQRPCALLGHDQLVDTHSDGAYTVLPFTADCAGDVRSIDVDYRLLFDLDPSHRGLLQIDDRGRVETAILSPERPTLRWARDGGDGLAPLLGYVREGVRHIWMGVDHVLFLVTLLLPSVLRRDRGGWRSTVAPRETVLPVVKVVTAFTVAHSITLGLAALGLIELPARPVEAAIAASVGIAAVNNIRPLVTERVWAVAFAFGLVHGVGFASVLRDLGLPSGAMVRSLLAFNLGVEAGQLAIVALVLPLLFAVRSFRFYPRVAMPAASAAIALAAGAWLIERTIG